MIDLGVRMLRQSLSEALSIKWEPIFDLAVRESRKPATSMFAVSIAVVLVAVLLTLLMQGRLNPREGEWYIRARERALVWLDLVDRQICKLAAAVVDRPWRWVVLVFIAVVDLGVGAYAPPAIALSGLACGLAICFAVFRLWSSDEEDRSKGLMGPNKRIRLTEDLTHEVWFVGVLAALTFPMGFYQIDVLEHNQAFKIPSQYGPFAGYFAYLAAELQRLVPVVREGELLNLQLFPDIASKDWAGRGAILFFRFCGDVLIIAVILKILEIAGRMRRGQDLRRQDWLLMSGKSALGIEAVEDLKRFVVRYDRFNALNRLTEITNPGRKKDAAPLLVRWRACEALQSIAVLKSQMSAIALEAALFGYRALSTDAFAHIELDVPGMPGTKLTQMVEVRVAQVMRNLGVRFGGAKGLEYLEQSVKNLRPWLPVKGKEAAPYEIQAAVGLASGLMILAERQAGQKVAANLRDAIEVLEKTYSSLDLAGMVEVQNTLGICRLTLGERIEGAEGTSLIERAEVAHRDALLYLGKLSKPPDPLAVDHFVRRPMNRDQVADLRADTLNHLATALLSAGSSMGVAGLGKLHLALEAYGDALKIYTKWKNPLNWSWIQTNIGSTWRSLSAMTHGSKQRSYLNHAIKAYALALQVRTAADTPMDWAWTQNNLGVAWRALAALSGPRVAIGLLNRAILAHEATLTIYDHEANPVGWAIAQMNLGMALHARANLAYGDEKAQFVARARAVLKLAAEAFADQQVEGFLVQVRAVLEEINAASPE